MKALVTGSGGLVGSACVELLCSRGWDVTGIDNDGRAIFFGAVGSTYHNTLRLRNKYPGRFQNWEIDVRDRESILLLVQTKHPNFIIHAAAQPSHDLAARIPFDDFDINAAGTLNLLHAARSFCPESPFVFVSTNKVYGDRPNWLRRTESEKRFDFVDFPGGIGENMPVDQCLHSLFGASKLAADIMAQEHGRYFNMPVGVFRGGCLTGTRHASVELHGFLSYIVRCAVKKKPYVLFGYGGKQVRDQIHASDVASLFLEFYENPRAGEVYNLGGGRANSASILEIIDALAARGFPLDYSIVPEPRRGDHACYYTDMTKAHTHFPGWRQERGIWAILDEILEAEGEQ